MKTMRTSGPAVLLAVLLLGGCSGTMTAGGIGGFGGGIVVNQEAFEVFETNRFDPEMHYFYTGSDVYPNAILGLKKGYRLEPDLWKPVGSLQQLREQVEAIRDKGRSLLHVPKGYAVVDRQGNPIGVWFSLSAAVQTAFMKDDQTVVVYTPRTDLYDSLEDQESPWLMPRF